MELAGLIEFLRLIVSEGLQTVVTAGVMFLAFKRAYKKLFSEENIIKIRDINERIDGEEGEQSRKKIINIQKYLEDNFSKFQEQGIDRCNIWIAHNSIKRGNFHFLYYSLIAEVVASGLELFSQHGISTEKNLHYQFAEYEDRAIGKKPSFAHIEELGQTAYAIAKDLGTKSIYIKAIYNLDGKVDGIIFFSSVFKKIPKEPKLDKYIDNIRLLFASK